MKNAEEFALTWRSRDLDQTIYETDRLIDRTAFAEAYAQAERQRAERLKKALREYGGHAPGCKLPMTPCSCGWHELRATLTPKQEAK